MKALADLHTHTIASGHAYSTLSEMVAAGQAQGLELMGITEHGSAISGTCDPLYFKNLWVVPRQWGQLRLLLGAELNILDTKGTIDMTEKDWRYMDIRLAGIHSICWDGGTAAQNTDGVIAAMHNPWINIISHPCDGTADLLFEPLVLASRETGTLLEINNNSIRPGRGKPKARANTIELLRLCRKHDVPVICGSDAHITFDVANFTSIPELLEETDFPDELILNDKPQQLLKLLGIEKS